MTGQLKSWVLTKAWQITGGCLASLKRGGCVFHINVPYHSGPFSLPYVCIKTVLKTNLICTTVPRTLTTPPSNLKQPLATKKWTFQTQQFSRTHQIHSGCEIKYFKKRLPINYYTKQLFHSEHTFSGIIKSQTIRFFIEYAAFKLISVKYIKPCLVHYKT